MPECTSPGIRTYPSAPDKIGFFILNPGVRSGIGRVIRMRTPVWLSLRGQRVIPQSEVFVPQGIRTGSKSHSAGTGGKMQVQLFEGVNYGGNGQ